MNKQDQPESIVLEHIQDLNSWAHVMLLYGAIILMACVIPGAVLWQGLPPDYAGWADAMAALIAGLVTLAAYCFFKARMAYRAAEQLRTVGACRTATR